MPANEQFLEEKLTTRREQLLFRELQQPMIDAIDFSSNDYLGVARSEKLQALIESRSNMQSLSQGATGSRLISGNHSYFQATEQFLADFHQAEAALIFNSGYNANVGLLSCIGGKGDTYISDTLSHASLIDGMRLSYAQRFRFKHSDLKDLEAKLQQAKGNTFVIVESIYSMDGDYAPLEGILNLTESYGAYLIVDEAHALGLFGAKGEGICMEQELHRRIFARIYTYGKGMGCHGAAIVGSQALKEYLVNFSRAFIYTTALPPHAVLTIQCAYEVMEKAIKERESLKQLISYFKQKLGSIGGLQLLPSNSAIQSIVISGNEAVTAVATLLQQEKIWAKAIRQPTVPEGQERIRLCIHAYNTVEEIDTLATVLAKAIKN